MPKSATIKAIHQLKNMNCEDLFTNFEDLTALSFSKVDSKSCNSLQQKVAIRRKLETQLDRINYLSKKREAEKKKIQAENNSKGEEATSEHDQN